MFTPVTSEAVAVSLKQYTAEEHSAAEDVLLPKIKSVDSIERYHQLLFSFYRFFKPVELLIADHIDHSMLPDINNRRTADTILVDTGQTFINDLSEELPNIRSVSGAIGALYVLEGSTLGGRGITRMLLANCSFLTSQQLHFFNGYGERTGPMWMRFVQFVNEYPYTSEEIEETLHTARETFYYFRQHLLKTLY